MRLPHCWERVLRNFGEYIEGLWKYELCRCAVSKVTALLPKLKFQPFVVTDVSENSNAFIFRVKQSTVSSLSETNSTVLRLLSSEDGGAAAFRNVSKLPTGRDVTGGIKFRSLAGNQKFQDCSYCWLSILPLLTASPVVICIHFITAVKANYLASWNQKFTQVIFLILSSCLTENTHYLSATKTDYQASFK